MDHVRLIQTNQIGRNFIPDEFLPKGKDEYYLRENQFDRRDRPWRRLETAEIEQLIKNGNTSDDWDEIFVTDLFDPGLILNSEFSGRIRIGTLQPVILEHHDLQIPAGIVQSKIVACDIGDNVAIHNVSYLAHFIIGDQCILANIDEMHTSNHAKFGNGIIKEGEDEKVRIWMDLMNETGSRRVVPFDGMIPADAYLWAKYRDDLLLQQGLLEMTQNQFDSRRGFYGTVGTQCVIKNSRILKDVKIGDCCYIKGANKLKNLTINSSSGEHTQIGEGVELVNGIIGYGCHIFYGVKAVRFVLGNHASLKYGARLIHSFLGANSTISCCEVLNNLIFPAHEQHHNNSFLIASVLLGQSNLAAGATIGSNHNSRANDNEVQAGRGFWPGLCSSIKHSCKFASFVLLSKADYPAEMHIPLPFSLLNNNPSLDRLEVMPAFWWLYNMYALARNTWKFQNRDQRKLKVQHIEFDSLAPDTVEEIVEARRLLEIWTAKAHLAASNETIPAEDEKLLRLIGQKLLSADTNSIKHLEILGERMEKSQRKVVLLKVWEAYKAYEEMLIDYAAKNIIQFLEDHPESSLEEMNHKLSGKHIREWVNLGGQLISESEVTRLRHDIGKKKLKTWEAIHERYNQLWESYRLDKQQHAYATLCYLLDIKSLDQDLWTRFLDRAVTVQETISQRVYMSRKKDFENPFRQATYRNLEEMTAAIGTIDDNSFVLQVKEETNEFARTVKRLKKLA